MLIERSPAERLPLTCRKIERETQRFRGAAIKWLLNFPSNGLADFNKTIPLLVQSELSCILYKIVKTSVTIRYNCQKLPIRGQFQRQWMTLSNLPVLKNFEILYRHQVHGSCALKESEGTFTSESCLDGSDRLLRRLFFAGEYDHRFTWPIRRMSLDSLVSILGTDTHVSLTHFEEPSQDVNYRNSALSNPYRNSITFHVSPGDAEAKVISRYRRCFHHPDNLWSTCGYADRCSEKEADPQSGSPLLCLPHNIQQKIWAFYYVDPKKAVAQTGSAIGSGLKIQDVSCPNLRLVCRKVYRDGRKARLDAPWTLDLAPHAHQGVVDIRFLSQWQELTCMFGKTTKVSIKIFLGLKKKSLDCSTTESRLKTQWAILRECFSNLNTLELSYRRRQRCYWQNYRVRSREDYRQEMQQGLHDDDFWWIRTRFSLDSLTKHLEECGRHGVEIYLTIEDEFKKSWQNLPYGFDQISFLPRSHGDCQQKLPSWRRAESSEGMKCSLVLRQSSSRTTAVLHRISYEIVQHGLQEKIEGGLR